MKSLHPQRGEARLHVWIAVAVIGVALLSLALFGPEQRLVAVPLYALTCIIAISLVALWQRDGSPPYFDLGVVCQIITFIYLAYPLLAFLLAGLEWSDISDNRFLVYKASIGEFAQVAWWGTVYLFSLCLAYYVVRREPSVTGGARLEMPSQAQIGFLFVAYLLIFLYIQAVQIIFDVDLNPTYGGDVRLVNQLPLFMQQITNKIYGIGIVFQFALILLLVSEFDDVVWRWTLILWAGLQVVTVIVIFGARSSMVFFVLAWLLAHQRLRTPLKPIALALTGAALVAGVLLYGLARDLGGRSTPADSVFSANTEFQALYATAYDLLRLRETGMLSDLPWQLYFADFLRLIPQQVLPFAKIDPGDWYLDILGLRGSGMGFMFGVTSEAAIGFGIAEMAVRGVIVGVCFGLIHNWYYRNARSFWATVFYLWLCVWSYYTYRASTFYLLAHVVFVFVPAYLLARIFSFRRRARGPRTRELAIRNRKR